MEKVKIVFTKKQFIKAVRNAEKKTCIFFDESPTTLKMGKSKFTLELEKELRKIWGSFNSPFGRSKKDSLNCDFKKGSVI